MESPSASLEMPGLIARSSALSEPSPAPTAWPVPAPPSVETFKDATGFVDRAYPPATARTLKSALRQIAWSMALIEARKTGRYLDPSRKVLDLRHIPFDPPVINQALEGVGFRLAGHDTEKTFRNAKSALRRIGRDLQMVAPHRAPELPPDTPYAPFLSVANEFELASARRFAARMTEEGWDPHDVTPDDLARYASFLSAGMIGVRVGPMLRRIARLWQLTASRHPDWPQTPLNIPSSKRPANPPFTAYPVSLQAEIADFRRWMEGTDQRGPFDPACHGKPLRPETVRLRLNCLRLILGEHAAQGHDPQSISSLRALLASPEAIQAVLQALWDRGQARQQAIPEADRDPSRNGSTGQLDAVGVSIMSLLEYFPPPPDVRQKLEWLVKRVRKAPMRAMSRKNRRRLDQFLDDPVKLALLLNLPYQLMAEAQALQTRQPDEAARLARAAVIFGIELKIPLRMKNLRTIRLGHNLRFTSCRSETATLTFPGHEMKNHRDVEYLAGPRLCQLLKAYIDHFRPFFTATSPDCAAMQWLFPAGRKQPGPLSASQVSMIINDTVAQRVGAAFHPHLFRALAVELGLQRNAAGHEHARQLLGHSSLQTVLAHYTPIRTKQAAAQQDHLVDKEAERLAPLAASVKRLGRRGGRP